MKSETKRKLAMAALSLAARYLRHRLQPAKLPVTTEKIKVVYSDGRVEEIDCKPVQREFK